jgi:hypothetical protein
MAVTPLLGNYVALNIIHLLDNSPFPFADPLSMLLATSNSSLGAAIMSVSRQVNARCPETGKGLPTGCQDNTFSYEATVHLRHKNVGRHCGLLLPGVC